MCISGLQVLNATYTSIHELAHCHGADALDLLQLKRAVIPCPRAKATLNHESTMNAHRITQANLAVDDASDQATYMLEDDRAFSCVLAFVFHLLPIPGDFCCAENALDDERHLVCWEIEVDWYGEAD